MTLITRDWLTTLRARAGHPNFAAAREALADQVAPYRQALPSTPVRQAGYYHDYFCPTHAVQLTFDPEQPRRHICPVDDAVFTGEPFDSAWRWCVNDLLSDAAFNLALSAALESNDVVLDGARALDILRAYAECYSTMQSSPVLHPDHPGVVTWSGLDESVWIIRLTWAHALLCSMTPDQTSPTPDSVIVDRLLQPAAEHLRRVRWPEIHNVRTWNNAALVTLALELDNGDLLSETLHGPLGVEHQLTKGILADGSWWEGSLSYHYYTLAAIVWTARALRAAGMPFPWNREVHRMFAAPLAVAYPDLTLPAIHDCWAEISLTGDVGHGIPDSSGFYEIAYGWYGDPAFAWVLHQNEAIRQRKAVEALLDGEPTVEPAQEPTIDWHAAAAAGLAVLRSRVPRERQTQVILKAGPAGAGHGHPDQLSIQLFAYGVRLVSDLGTAGYGIGLNDTWYRQTASHATIIVDGQSQPIVSARIDRYDPDGEIAVAEGTVAWDLGGYCGVHLRRTLVMRDHYCLDVVQVRCPEPRQIDWLLPCLGVLVEAPVVDPASVKLSGSCGYEHFTSVQKLATADRAQFRWQAGPARLGLFLPPENGERFVATAPGNPATESVSAVVRRQFTEATHFVAVLAPSTVDAPANVSSVNWLASEPWAFEVETSAGTERWEIGAEGGIVQASGSDAARI